MARTTLEDLPLFAQKLLNRIHPSSEGAFVIFLQGNLGAGKTTFMQYFARALGIEEPVQSPTFVLMKSYPLNFEGFTKLVHIDAYRLEGAMEFQPLKPAQFLDDPRAIVCIEWPERVGEALPSPDMVVRFSHTEGEENAREIELA